jgi:hypothetical protein
MFISSFVRVTIAGLLAATLALSSFHSFAADEPAKKPDPKLTFTDPAAAAEADPDFSVQGEYVGRIAWPGRGYAAVGLQVVALGNGKFDGVLYYGGLPGAGWDHGERVPLDGGRNDYGVQLVGWAGSIAINGSTANFTNGQGRPAGSLHKTQRISSMMGARPPATAVVLFDETTKNLDQWNKAKLTKEGYLHSGTMTKEPVGDFRLHAEFRTPFMPNARGQGRGNSGVYIQQRYEAQILDSFGLKGIENECGALYKQQAPDLNMCLPPLEWQTYDLYFTAARWSEDGKTKTANAKITLFHNGVAVHQRREITNKTGAGKEEGPQEFPINIQDHGNPVALRNVWIIFGDATEPAATNPTCVCVPQRRR